jgi:hypothetical protein
LFVLAARFASPVRAADGEKSVQAPARTFEVRIEKRRVAQAQRVLRATQGEPVELRWTTDEPLVLHLHGYDIETRVAPDQPAVTAFTARLTGRFPVAIHAENTQGRGGSGHHHSTLLYVEVHPK